MDGLRFKIGGKSFFQTNSLQARTLYNTVREFAELKPEDVVYDLYTGTGTIALYVARSCARVVGVEYVEEAIADARINAEVNNINNSTFYAGDMKDVLNQNFIKSNGTPDVIILDPPRAGIHPDVAQTILNAAPRRIVYVSCNPATQARDLALLNEKYRITRVQPVDMFPHTQHVENVVRLEKID
jgi:23S rRNA (uracil1939-C5)-methyltransferase